MCIRDTIKQSDVFILLDLCSIHLEDECTRLVYWTMNCIIAIIISCDICTEYPLIVSNAAADWSFRSAQKLGKNQSPIVQNEKVSGWKNIH